MKIFVAGLWHLGCVTTACLVKGGHEVIAYDPEQTVITQLQSGKTPIFEPGLDDLLNSGVKTGRLHYSSSPQNVADAEIVWITFDTPVDDHDIADIDVVTHEIERLFPHIAEGSLLLISSQLPVGTTRKLQQQYVQKWSDKNVTFAYIPENLRLGKAIDVFTHPDRFVVGIQSENDKNKIQALLKPFTETIIWMSIESAEMTKHALNAFLATSVVFINELAILCERVGANAREVELGLKSEERIGAKAYLRPGNAIAGGTLARDVNYLIQIGQTQKLETPLFSALLESNQHHKQWSARKLIEIFHDLKNKSIAILGLTYKAGTNTLRRSTAVEFCQWLSNKGAKVIAHDPAVINLPEDLLQFIELKPSISEVLMKVDAIVISTECAEFTSLTADQLLANIKSPLVLDPSGFLSKKLGNDERIRYFSVGRQA